MFCLCPRDLTSVETCISSARDIKFPMSCVWRNPKSNFCSVWFVWTLGVGVGAVGDSVQLLEECLTVQHQTYRSWPSDLHIS